MQELLLTFYWVIHITYLESISLELVWCSSNNLVIPDLWPNATRDWHKIAHMHWGLGSRLPFRSFEMTGASMTTEMANSCIGKQEFTILNYSTAGFYNGTITTISVNAVIYDSRIEWHSINGKPIHHGELEKQRRYWVILIRVSSRRFVGTENELTNLDFPNQ